jgi:hypothetical protein
MVGLDSFWPLYPNLSQSTARTKRETHNSGSVLCTQCRGHLKQSHNHEPSQPTFTSGRRDFWGSFPVSSRERHFLGPSCSWRSSRQRRIGRSRYPSALQRACGESSNPDGLASLPRLVPLEETCTCKVSHEADILAKFALRFAVANKEVTSI